MIYCSNENDLKSKIQETQKNLSQFTKNGRVFKMGEKFKKISWSLVRLQNGCVFYLRGYGI